MYIDTVNNSENAHQYQRPSPRIMIAHKIRISKWGRIGTNAKETTIQHCPPGPQLESIQDGGCFDIMT
jgi:hypothetical protein